MRTFWPSLRNTVKRVFPAAPTQAQAVAFNSFLAFFPMLLVALGVLGSSVRLSSAVEEIVSRLRSILPPGGQRMVVDYVLGRGGQPMTWILFGLGGTVLGGTQVMASLMQGFRVVYLDESGPGFWRDQWRGFRMLCLVIGPWIAAVMLTVFGRQLRIWAIHQFGLAGLINAVWTFITTALALVLAMITLAVIYRVGRPQCRGWQEVWPGTVVATLLWWLVNTGFGFYVRKVPYSMVYGGLAAAIGLLVWMYLSALVVLIGAAYNAAAVHAFTERRHAKVPPDFVSGAAEIRSAPPRAEQTGSAAASPPAAAAVSAADAPAPAAQKLESQPGKQG